MKKLVIVLATILLIAVGCQTAAAKEAADDIVSAPGGWYYRANSHQDGVENPWPSINSSEVPLGENISVDYRSYIETAAGETRNNIVYVHNSSYSMDFDLSSPSVNLSISNIPAGMKVNESGGGGRPGWTEPVLTIDIHKDVKPGEYTFNISIEVDGKDYGKLPCTINVTK